METIIANFDRPTADYHSLGQCCLLLKLDANQLRALAVASGVAPAITIDAVPYFDQGQLERLQQARRGPG